MFKYEPIELSGLDKNKRSEKYSNDECITTPQEWSDWLEGKMKDE